MNSATAERLNALTRQFYNEHGRDFSETRVRLQPGVILLLGKFRKEAAILDLGCGNGELARSLARRGHQGAYLGLDFSLSLLSEAEREPFTFPAKFLKEDLTASDWVSVQVKGKFDLVFAFAVLHHIPGTDFRLDIIRKVHELLDQEGSFILSNWQFLDNPRLKARIQPWELVGLTPQNVDPNDYLLDWKRGSKGLRYVHHFDENELAELAKESRFQIVETFYSDGENKRSGLYQIWKKT
jgi:2-polyprenyl-3-methyl-5-hydroxy-6-metoxy-1,4-benzoquinol methylase